MINITHTLLSTIKTHINNLKYLGINDPKIFKKIIYAVLLHDLSLWCDYLDDSKCTLRRIEEIKRNFLICNKEFLLERINLPTLFQPYVNVNTPQSNYTWKRVWDLPKVTEVETPIMPTEHILLPFVPDYSCEQQLVYYPSDMYGGILRSTEIGHEGEPYIINFNNLTTCEKMNIFVDREDGKMYYLDPDTGTWKPIIGSSEVTTVPWSKITGKPYVGISHNLVLNETETDKSARVELLESFSSELPKFSEDIKLTTINGGDLL